LEAAYGLNGARINTLTCCGESLRVKYRSLHTGDSGVTKIAEVAGGEIVNSHHLSARRTKMRHHV
jgi:hypothetical protein